jgi:hypothetical protein
MSNYKKIYDQNAVIHLQTGRVIYLDQPVTIHTETYLAWVADGNIPDSADIPAPSVIAPGPAPAVLDPVQKLQAFLAANPDVAALL